MKTMTKTLVGVGLLVLPLWGCTGNTTSADLAAFPQADHPYVPLKDVSGNDIRLGSTEPYSPKQTCGGCHDYDHITQAYHFQQGRTDGHGKVIAKDDYFEDGRTFLQSPGMYGKW